MSLEVSILSFYKFQKLSAQELTGIRSTLTSEGSALGAKGLILVGHEGVNGTVAVEAQNAPKFESLIQNIPQIGSLEFKRSTASKIPFAHYKVKVRPEIVTIGKPGFAPLEKENTLEYLDPAEWNELLNSGREDIVVLDTRNNYESKLGKFENAITPDISEFRNFGSYLEKAALPKDKTYMIYCTGGIRCEKAALEMYERGYEHVLQLKGGILKYIEEFPDQKFEGECFVFDHRVAVDQKLRPTERYRNCPHCGQPGESRITCKRCDTPCCICESCAEQSHLHSCSKNCAYHLRLKPFQKGKHQVVVRTHNAKRKEV